jgi:hypothetical protein
MRIALNQKQPNNPLLGEYSGEGNNGKEARSQKREVRSENALLKSPVGQTFLSVAGG